MVSAAFGRRRRKQAAVEQEHAVDASAADELGMVALARGIVGGVGDHETIAMLVKRVGDAAQHLREEDV